MAKIRNKQQYEDLISKGKIEEALKHLQDHVGRGNRKGARQEVNQLQGSFSRTQYEYRLGTITHEQYQAAISRLTKALLTYLSEWELEEADLDKQTGPGEAPPRTAKAEGDNFLVETSRYHYGHRVDIRVFIFCVC